MKMSIKFSFESVLFEALVANIYPCIIKKRTEDNKEAVTFKVSAMRYLT